MTKALILVSWCWPLFPQLHEHILLPEMPAEA